MKFVDSMVGEIYIYTSGTIKVIIVLFGCAKLPMIWEDEMDVVGVWFCGTDLINNCTPHITTQSRPPFLLFFSFLFFLIKFRFNLTSKTNADHCHHLYTLFWLYHYSTPTHPLECEIYRIRHFSWSANGLIMGDPIGPT